MSYYDEIMLHKMDAWITDCEEDQNPNEDDWMNAIDEAYDKLDDYE